MLEHSPQDALEVLALQDPLRHMVDEIVGGVEGDILGAVPAGVDIPHHLSHPRGVG